METRLYDVAVHFKDKSLGLQNYREVESHVDDEILVLKMKDNTVICIPFENLNVYHFKEIK